MPVRHHAYAPPPPAHEHPRRRPRRRAQLAALVMLTALAGALAMPLRVEAAGNLLSALQPASFLSGAPGSVLLSGEATEAAVLRADLNGPEQPCAAESSDNAAIAASAGLPTPVVAGPFEDQPAVVTPAAGPGRWITICAYLSRPGDGATLGHVEVRWFVVERAGDQPPPVPELALGSPDGLLAGQVGQPKVEVATDTCTFGPPPRSASGRLRISCPGVSTGVSISAGHGTRTRWFERRFHRGQLFISARNLRLSRKSATRIEVWQYDRLIGRASLKLRGGIR